MSGDRRASRLLAVVPRVQTRRLEAEPVRGQDHAVDHRLTHDAVTEEATRAGDRPPAGEAEAAHLAEVTPLPTIF